MMMTMNQSSAFDNSLINFNNPNNAFNQSTLSLTDPDVDWSVFENADRYLLRDDSAWITRLSRDFWWNLERISEMTTTTDVNHIQKINSTKHIPQQISSSSSSMQLNGMPTRKIVGQRSTIIARPNRNNIPIKTNSSSTYDQDFDYNPFQSKISFDNNIWTNYLQHAIPWQ